MNKRTLTIPFIIKTDDELSEAERMLCAKAKEATLRSYSPYSHFSVGAALELSDGTIVSGSNQENAAYPSGLCAERVAMFYATSSHPDLAIRRMCITARDVNGTFVTTPISPCGACRQSLLEAELRHAIDIEVLLYGTAHTIILQSIKSLLPLAFCQTDLQSSE